MKVDILLLVYQERGKAQASTKLIFSLCMYACAHSPAYTHTHTHTHTQASERRSLKAKTEEIRKELRLANKAVIDVSYIDILCSYLSLTSW